MQLHIVRGHAVALADGLHMHGQTEVIHRYAFQLAGGAGCRSGRPDSAAAAVPRALTNQTRTDPTDPDTAVQPQRTAAGARPERAFSQSTLRAIKRLVFSLIIVTSAG